MCGIFAYTGNGSKNASDVLLDGLVSLEYRGYDSAGIFVPEMGAARAAGAVANLRKKIPPDFAGNSGIAHLRWATHGEPSESNAHPHQDCGGEIWIVHNGIIENHREIKKQLIEKDHIFASDTDTEVLSHLIEEHLKSEKNFEYATRAALKEVRGTYGIAIQYSKEPRIIIGARMGAPVVLGLGDGEYFIASDASPLLRHTRQIVFLEDGDVVVIKPESYEITRLDATHVERKSTEIDWNENEAQKDGYEHFMLKEIMEEPDVIENTLRGRIIHDRGLAKLGGLENVQDDLAQIKRIIIVGCGTAYYAGLIGEYMLESYAGIPVEVEFASEFRYRSPVINDKTVVLAISQSGETADTLEALREGKRRGALTLGIVNTVGSTIARETDAGIYNHAGSEIGVASTKSFISQIIALSLFTLFLGRQRSMSMETAQDIERELLVLPSKVKTILNQRHIIEALALKYANARDFLYIGRTYNYPVALEGALKLKELSYIHAEGCSAGEMKHGSLAMIDDNFPTIAIAPKDHVYEKMLSNIQEIRTRKGPIIAIATEGDSEIAKLTDDVFYVPPTIDLLQPILSAVPLQLFAYYFANAKGYNADRPRNLAKSVTVE
jgi:glucosamine--fructose-6-phosphate aminotransferase (isomerizing)